MTSTIQDDPVLVTNASQLERLTDRLLDESIVAVDTESNSLFAYQEQVCLIQFSASGKDFLVDPLALDDLSPLAPLFSSSKIEKVFHAAEYDLICMKRDFGFEFDNIFDTMVAARILGRKEVGLGSLIEAEFGVHLEKRYQRANWGQRPLPPHLLSYARLDTHYLIQLRDRLWDELHRKGLWMLGKEDFKRLNEIDGHFSTNGKNGQDRVNPWRIKGVKDLTHQQAAVLYELCRYRDRVAKSLNRPLFKVINNHTLLAIAMQTPGNMRDLSTIPGMSPKQVRRHGRHLLEAVELGLRAEPLYPPRSPRPSDAYLQRVERLRYWRKIAAQEMGVPSDVILPKDIMYLLAAENPANKEELSRAMSSVPWRLERYGDQILEVLSKG
jgi:ribonuclease D